MRACGEDHRSSCSLACLHHAAPWCSARFCCCFPLARTIHSEGTVKKKKKCRIFFRRLLFLFHLVRPRSPIGEDEGRRRRRRRRSANPLLSLVWGFICVLICARKPASRFKLSTYIGGHSLSSSPLFSLSSLPLFAAF